MKAEEMKRFLEETQEIGRQAARHTAEMYATANTIALTQLAQELRKKGALDDAAVKSWVSALERSAAVQRRQAPDSSQALAHIASLLGHAFGNDSDGRPN